ncbi:hypothetical protein N7532_005216 [Penicillium argentinense]|uniref:Uncharacterized protein n=1 Tax=Penicillium argentinense TaxID=1131581 RepID=A0A9W9FDS2_9EURO|nr:uncharacterized protein N7532_005216 [Penicillium argentinense]KAJ5098215.1 hypothetical protein N7532_005216 [Penicillium argentinense]
MNLSTIPFLSALGLGNTFYPLDYFGLNQQPHVAIQLDTLSLNSEDAFINMVPETPFYDIESDQQAVRDALARIKSSDFIAWDASFFDIIGPNAKLERIQTFGEPATVHEAPAFVPETNELFFSDTQITGWLWAIHVDTLQILPMVGIKVFPNVQAPEIPTDIYVFNMKTKALNVATNNVVITSNGLVFSPNG